MTLGKDSKYYLVYLVDSIEGCNQIISLIKNSKQKGKKINKQMEQIEYGRNRHTPQGNNKIKLESPQGEKILDKIQF